MALQRRAFLLSSVAALSGCSSLTTDPTPTTTERPDGDGDGVPDGVDDYPGNPDLAYRSSSSEGTLTVNPGDFSAYQLQGPGSDGENHLRYEASVVGDGTVDVVVFERGDYDEYEDGARDVPVVDRYTRTDVTEASVLDALGDRELILAVDNTELLSPATDQPVDVEFLLEIAEPADDSRQTATE